MKVEIKFSRGQKVKVIEIDTVATIKAVLLESDGVSYKVAVWSNGDRKEVWCFEEELIAAAAEES